ncbi:putative non-functional NADPH-dependent codeinone reductase 2-like [Capsicum annuum]|nr:putative non-functional NADPH-dependent codeinone reductase 2-like [Capsicum annuum]
MGTAGAFFSVPLNYQFYRRPLHFQPLFLLPITWPLTPFSRKQIIKLYCRRSSGSRLLLTPPRALLSRQSREGRGSSEVDPDLRSVLELATDSELYELQRILFGPSYFSPMLKSVTKRTEFDCVMVGEDPEERADFLSMLESRFLYLAADARSTLRGRRPSYREVLLGVREKLSIRCSAKLSAEDLEAEIFLHLLQEYSSSIGFVKFVRLIDTTIDQLSLLLEWVKVPHWLGNKLTVCLYELGLSSPHELAFGVELSPGAVSLHDICASSEESLDASDGHGGLEFGLSKWKVQAAAALKAGAEGVRSIILKLARRFSGKMLLEAANYQISKEVLKKGGELAALNLESRLALLAARKGLAGAASRYFGLRSMMTFLGPMIDGRCVAPIHVNPLCSMCLAGPVMASYAPVINADAAPILKHLIQFNPSSQLPIKLTGSTNFTIWKAQIVMLLHGHDLYGSPFNNEELVVKILSELGSKFREISAAIRARDSLISYEELFDKVLDHELFLKYEDLKKTSTQITVAVAQRVPNPPSAPSATRNNKRPSNNNNWRPQYR